jgi:hypothetical protein
LLATGLAAVFGAVTGGLAAGFAATFEAVAFEPVAFAAVFAVLFGIALLLFFEDFAAEAFAAFRVLLTGARPRLLLALRVGAAAFLEEALFLRVFCDTACARNSTPLLVFHGRTHRGHKRADGFGL